MPDKGGDMGGLSLRQGDAETWDNMLCDDKSKYATVGAAETAFKDACKGKHPAALCSAVLEQVFKGLDAASPWSPSDKLCAEVDELITASDDSKAALLLDRSAIQEGKDADSQLDAALLGKGGRRRRRRAPPRRRRAPPRRRRATPAPTEAPTPAPTEGPKCDKEFCGKMMEEMGMFDVCGDNADKCGGCPECADGPMGGHDFGDMPDKGGDMGGLSLRQGDAETWDNMLCDDKSKYATVGAAETAFKDACKGKHPAALCSAVLDQVFKGLDA